jgi:dienelactone hydrolase
MQITDGPMVEVWYPAVDGTTGTVTYDARDYVPEAVSAILTGDVASTYTIEAGRDAGVATPTDAGFPVVAYSHGFSGFRTIASFLTSHLASWGAVVVAPDHPSRDLNSQLGGGVENPSDPTDELAASVGLVASDERFAASVDVGRVVPIGHSAGGSTVIGFAERNGGVVGYVALASGRRDETPAPDVPSLHLAGRADEIIPSERSAAAFETAATPATFWLIDEVGHNGFTDLCTYGDGTGIIGVAEASGLDGLLDAQPQFRRLGEDGCVPPAAPVELAHPIMLHAVTAWVADVAGLDVGLDPSLGAATAGQYELEVTAETRP